jgi:hypothetical protein
MRNHSTPSAAGVKSNHWGRTLKTVSDGALNGWKRDGISPGDFTASFGSA